MSLERTTLAVVLGLALAMPIGAATAASAIAAPSSRGLVLVAGGVLIAVAFAGALTLRKSFAPSLDGAARRRPMRALLWALLALLSLAQLGRLSAFMADPTLTWGSTVPSPGVIHHNCLSAYVYAADLSRRGEPNLYDEAHYPAFRENGDGPPAPASSVAELDSYIWDPYEYPPQFLLLPRLGLALSDHFLVLRAAWFAMEAVSFILAALAMAGFIGGRAGVVVGLLVPALVSSGQGCLNLQYGQAHVMAYALSLGALAAFARGRGAIGGALLGAATVFKIFPGLLVLYLILRRRFRDLAWTLAAGAALTLVALAVVGTAPFVELVRYQLPRIGDGEAFAWFRRDWGSISRNFGFSGIVFKLGVLGVPGMSASLANAVGWIYSVALVGLVVRAARRGEGDRLSEASMWLGLLGLASLRTPFGPGDYVAIGGLWLLTLVAARARRPRDVVVIVVAWLVIQGAPPLPSARVDIVVAFAGQLAMIALCVCAVWGRRSERMATSIDAQRVVARET